VAGSFDQSRPTGLRAAGIKNTLTQDDENACEIGQNSVGIMGSALAQFTFYSVKTESKT